MNLKHIVSFSGGKDSPNKFKPNFSLKEFEIKEGDKLKWYSLKKLTWFRFLNLSHQHCEDLLIFKREG